MGRIWLDILVRIKEHASPERGYLHKAFVWFHIMSELPGLRSCHTILGLPYNLGLADPARV